MVAFTTVLKKFAQQGEKTGWTYIEIPVEIAGKIKSGQKTSFRVKGKIDAFKIAQTAMLPMGEGAFIIPVNAAMRKGIGKKQGASVQVMLEEDKSAFKFSSDFIECLKDEPKALAHFNSLAGSHQKYFSKWIDSAKTIDTKAKRIAMAVKALAQKMGYAEMLRANKKSNS